MAKNLSEMSLAARPAGINQVPCDREMRNIECLLARWAVAPGKKEALLREGLLARTFHE